MQSSPAVAGALAAREPGRIKRCRYRRPLHTLAYVTLGPENGGILRDVSDQGASLHTVLPLEVGQPVHLRFDLFSPGGTPSRLRLEAAGKVVWSSGSGQAGVQFTSLPSGTRRQLNEWILGTLLASIAQASPMLNAAGLEERDENLMLSSQARAPIAVPLSLQPRVAHATDDDLLLDWVLSRMSPSAVRRCVDGLVLSAAVLLFLVIALAVAKALPDWRIALLLAIGVWIFVAGLYRGLSGFFGIPTAGKWVAHIAQRQWPNAHESAETRFR